MKNLTEKAHIAPLIGIIAITVVIGFMMLSCGEVDEEALEEFPNPTITVWEFGPDANTGYTGKPLTAVYNGKTKVTYSWYSVAGGTTPIAGATTATYTPADAGSYYVRVTEDKTLGTKSYKNSGNVTVRVAPEYVEYFGKWLMKGTINKWEPETGKGDGYDETIILKESSFRLDSTYNGEFLQYNISTWQKITGTDLTVSTPGLPASVGGANTAASDITYGDGYTLTVSGGTTNGYSPSHNDTTLRLLKINTTESSQIRRTTSTNVLPRVYIKQ